MSVPGLERGIAILRLFRRDRPQWTAPQIAAELAIPRSTVHRLLMTLVELGLVRRDGDGRFSADSGVLMLGFEYLSSLDLLTLASPLLEQLRDETNWSTHLAVRQGRSVIYLGRFPSRTSLTRNITVGSSVPAHATLMGRLMLCDLEPTALRELYAGHPLAGASPESPQTLAELERLLTADRAFGFAASRTGFFEPGIQTIAAPIRDDRLNVIAAINATAFDNAGMPFDEVQPLVIAAAARISQLLGAPVRPERAPAAPAIGEKIWH